jgi:N-acetylmuramoyl-L-alanine amidase
MRRRRSGLFPLGTMLTPVLRFLALSGCSLSLGYAAAAAETSGRFSPTRPGTPVAAAALPTRQFGTVAYVRTTEVASRLGLKHAWVERGRRISLTGALGRATIGAATREISVNGLRVFLGDPVQVSGGNLYVSQVDFERCLAPMLKPGHGVPRPSVPRTIVLDPGHGGRDFGRVNAALGVNEKTLTLDTAQRLKALLERAGYRVILTRNDDSYLELGPRAVVANTNRADLFVSIHFNALPNNATTSGMEIFTFAPQFQRSTNAWSPGQRNDTEKTAAPANRNDHWNVVLAQAIHRRFINDLKVFDRGKKIAHWGVLRSLNCPGVLVECGFLTSEAEARKISTPAYRQQLAQTLFAGIRDYAATLQGLK